MLTLNSILKSLKRLVNEEFECPICLDLCSDTHLSPDCGHRFCGKCIKESIRKCNHECPTCRFPIKTHRSCRQDPQFDRMLRRLVTELIEPLDKQMIGQNKKEDEDEEAKDLNKEDRKLAPPSHHSAEDFEGPGPVSTSEEERKVQTVGCQTTRKRNRRDKNGDKHLLGEEDGNVPSECKRPRKKISSSFNERFKELAHFKRDHGNCHVPQKRSKDAKHFSLGLWVKNIRSSYKRIQRGEKPHQNLSEADIKRLDDIGFEWEPRASKTIFDEHYTDLLKFREEYGHCRVPQTKKSKDAKYYSLGLWVSNMRVSYRAMQRGEKPHQNLSEADIKRLDDIGLEWESSRNAQTFDEHYTDLLKFREEYGHCRVTQTKKSKDAKHFSLGRWVSNMRSSYRAMQRGEKPHHNLSEADIKRLEDIGFEWESSRTLKASDDR